MNQTALSQIELSIRQLPTREQQLLISRVAETLRKQTEDENEFDRQMAAMAADEEIQAELKRIEQDFAVTDFDGLAE
ncbi:MAG: hypothetical protein ABL999_09745 [Pyrinomonadaceae bacterium]